jgi:hypothetical protein
VTRRDDFAQHWAVFSVEQQDFVVFVSIFMVGFSSWWTAVRFT